MVKVKFITRLKTTLKKYVWELLMIFFGRVKVSKAYLKKYLYLCDSIKPDVGTPSTYVWTIWFQDEIPEVCQLCIASIKKFYPNTILVTEKNLHEYVDIPDYIFEKYKAGIIKPAHFSDIVRICLLEKYGGVWFDATAFVTQPIPKYVNNYDFYILKYPLNKEYKVNNFFIASNKGHFMTTLMKNFLFEYWKHEYKAVEYFFFHHFLYDACEYNCYCKELWDNMPLFLTYRLSIHLPIMTWDYNPDLYDYIKKSNFLYKLTYKFSFDINPNSIFNHLLNEYRKTGAIL